LGTSSTDWNGVVENAVSALLRAMGINVNDPRSTWPGAQYQVFSERHEDSEGNPLHLILVLATIALLPRGGTRTQMFYLVCLIVAFFLFGLVLRWQPWGSRLLLPLFVVAMPLSATLFANRVPGKLILLPAALLSLAAIPYLLENPSRPVLGSESVFLNARLHQYFSNVPDDVAAYESAASAILGAGCNNVGLVTRYDGREYLAWITVRRQVPDARLEHILVKNPSRRYADEAFSPCAIIVMKGLPGDTLAFRSRAYLKAVETDTLDLFLEHIDPD
jgi:hypothetical protein